MSWNKVKIGSFLKENIGRFKPVEANKMGLKRIEKIDFSGTYHLVDKTTNTDMILVKKGDLLISGINAEKGAVTVYNDNEDALATIHYSSYEFDKEKIDVEYFKWFLISDAFKTLLIDSAGNGIKTELKSKHLLPLEIFLPDKNAQIEIVKNIIKKHKSIAEIRKTINQQQTYLKQLRQAILQEAVQGKLTQQNKTDEPASILLQRIKAEKQKLIVAGKIKKEKELTPITKDEIPFELPKGWVWCRLGELIELISGQHIEANDYNEKGVGLPYLTGPSDFGVISPIFSRWSEKPKVLAQKDDILITVKGSGVGKLNILHESNVAIGRQLMAVRVKFLKRDFVRIFLDSIFETLQNEKAGIAIPGISREDILEKIFSLPSLSEQHRIVTKVQQLLQMTNQLEQQVAQSQTQAKQLLQSVLKEAFTKSNSAKIIEIAKSTIAPRKILAGHIIQLCNNSNHFGHTTFQKNLYLCEMHAKITAYETNYIKDRAGPFDKDFFFPFLKEMEKEEWFYEEPKRSITYFRTGEKVGKLVKDYATHFRQYNNEIRFVLQLMKDKTTDESELVATIYAVWNNHLILKKEFDNSTLIQEVYDWSSSKIKFTKTDITNTWQWMKEQNFIPHGWGKLIEKNNKK